jgi:hypothetical protein
VHSDSIIFNIIPPKFPIFQNIAIPHATLTDFTNPKKFFAHKAPKAIPGVEVRPRGALATCFRIFAGQVAPDAGVVVVRLVYDPLVTVY